MCHLHSNPVRPQPQVALPPDNVLSVWFVKMGVEDLLGEGEWPGQPGLHHLQVLDQLLVRHRGALVELAHGNAGDAGGAQPSRL